MSNDNDFQLDGSTLEWKLGAGANFSIDKARELAAFVREGSYKGAAVSAGRVVFSDQAQAQAQADALGFLKLGSFGPAGRAKSADFSVREDFGIPPEA